MVRCLEDSDLCTYTDTDLQKMVDILSTNCVLFVHRSSEIISFGNDTTKQSALFTLMVCSRGLNGQKVKSRNCRACWGGRHAPLYSRVDWCNCNWDQRLGSAASRNNSKVFNPSQHPRAYRVILSVCDHLSLSNNNVDLELESAFRSAVPQINLNPCAHQCGLCTKCFPRNLSNSGTLDI